VQFPQSKATADSHWRRLASLRSEAGVATGIHHCRDLTLKAPTKRAPSRMAPARGSMLRQHCAHYWGFLGRCLSGIEADTAAKIHRCRDLSLADDKRPPAGLWLGGFSFQGTAQAG
jgi:hypothetical protein